MAALIAGLPAVLQGQSVGEALSGVFGSVSLTAWICLLVGPHLAIMSTAR